MAELKCSVENCTYNDQHLCCKGDIMVGGRHASSCDETCCESFVPRREGQDTFKNSTSHPCNTISSDCKAGQCEYNSDYKCTAGLVDICGCGACDCSGTACATFTDL